jgi:heat shock protein HslJ
MTGMPHPETIELAMADEHVSGCGGAPLALLTGRTWLVEAVDGAGLVDAARVTLGFGSDGRVAGSGGCNRWVAGFDLTGEGLYIGLVGATMMACAPAVMDQERRFFEILAKVSGFTFDDSGALLLLAGGAPVITARSTTDGSAP